MFKRIGQVLAASALVTGSFLGAAQAAEELNFGIISTESSQNLKAMWDPFLADMSKQTGVKIKAMSELTVAYPYTPTPLSSKSMG